MSYLVKALRTWNSRYETNSQGHCLVWGRRCWREWDLGFIAIDFGTSFCKVACADAYGRPTVIPIQGQVCIPALVFWQGSNTRIGLEAQAAFDNGTDDAERLIAGIKRNLNADYRVNFSDGSAVGAVEVVTAVLRYIKEQVEALSGGQDYEQVTLTYPASFTSNQRSLLYSAGVEAGFTTVNMLPEPIAVVHAYSAWQSPLGRGTLVYSLGGGNCEVSYVQPDGHGGFTMPLAPVSSNKCGGREFDYWLYRYVALFLDGEPHLSWSADRGLEPGLLRACTEAKERLSTFEQVQLKYYFEADNYPCKLEVSRQTLEGPIRQRVEGMSSQIKRLLAELKQGNYQLESLIVSGAQASMPVVADFLHKELPWSPLPSVYGNLDVALGAARWQYLQNHPELSLASAGMAANSQGNKLAVASAIAQEPFYPANAVALDELSGFTKKKDHEEIRQAISFIRESSDTRPSVAAKDMPPANSRVSAEPVSYPAPLVKGAKFSSAAKPENLEAALEQASPASARELNQALLSHVAEIAEDSAFEPTSAAPSQVAASIPTLDPRLTVAAPSKLRECAVGQAKSASTAEPNLTEPVSAVESHSDRTTLGSPELQVPSLDSRPSVVVDLQQLGQALPLVPGQNATVVLAPGNSIELIWCPAGTFMMGSPKGSEYYTKGESLHQVTLTKGFWIGKYPVTQRQYQAIKRENPSLFRGLELPVERVSWYESYDFCRRLNGLLGSALPEAYACALPTDAQWEYACRAGTTSALYDGQEVNSREDLPKIRKIAWCCIGTTQPIGLKPPNAWGLHDMCGNVWEWCHDWWQVELAEAIDPLGPCLAKGKLRRGGAFSTAVQYCRSAYRHHKAPDTQAERIGFRLAIRWVSSEERATNDYVSKVPLARNSDGQLVKVRIAAETKPATAPGTNVMGLKRELLPEIDSKIELATETSAILAEKPAKVFAEVSSSAEQSSPASNLTAEDSSTPETSALSSPPADTAALETVTTEQVLTPVSTEIDDFSTPVEGKSFAVKLPGDIMLDLVWCPAGSFMMGSPEEEPFRKGNENRHEVTLTRGFWLGQYAVTQQQYKAVIGSNPSEIPGIDYPVTNVKWREAYEYCQQLNSLYGHLLPPGFHFALPSESQWEYACRAGSQTGLYTGEDLNHSPSCSSLRNLAVYWYTRGPETLHRVGSKKSNSWNLYDMYGNTYEWCADYYGLYDTTPQVDPLGPSKGIKRVRRSCPSSGKALQCRSAYRSNEEPEEQSGLTGFRVAVVYDGSNDSVCSGADQPKSVIADGLAKGADTETTKATESCLAVSERGNGYEAVKPSLGCCAQETSSSNKPKIAEADQNSPAASSGLIADIGVEASSATNDVPKQTEVFQPKEGENCGLFLQKGGWLELIWCPAGSFDMGSPAEESAGEDEQQHRVNLSRGFWLGRYPVTRQQYNAVMRNSVFTNETVPVSQITWIDACSFCHELNKMNAGRLPEGYEFALPTEAQWEYACRAGTTSRLYSGANDSEAKSVDDLAFSSANSGGKTRPVGGKLPNEWGFHDMYGNVWEWCHDWYGDYPEHEVFDPCGPKSGTERCRRGGSFYSQRDECRSAYRYHAAQNSSKMYIGMRVALRYVGSEPDKRSDTMPKSTVSSPAASAAISTTSSSADLAGYSAKHTIPEAQPQNRQVIVAEPEAPAASSNAIKQEALRLERNGTLELTSEASLDLIWCPAGKFFMGCSQHEMGWKGDEPSHQVALTKGYWLGKYPVTQQQYLALTGSNPAFSRNSADHLRCPVEQVSWSEAKDFCELLNGKFGQLLPGGYRFSLPSEAQWERACRADTNSAYNINHCYDREDYIRKFLRTMAWYCENSECRTHAVGSLEPNGWGLYDMHGNVSEWCLDGYNCYPSGTLIPTDPVAAADGTKAVVRGGSWKSTYKECRAASRGTANLDGIVDDSYCIGFRVAVVAL